MANGFEAWAIARPIAALLLMLGGCARPLKPEPGSSTQESVPSSTTEGDARAPPPTARLEQGVAVVELFTSEGCSSCPPADRALARLAARATRDGRPIYGLSFHVDYWNYLGWSDRFSDSNYSERQRRYASLNPTGSIYTPQAVINGEAEIVGSDGPGIDAWVSRALQRKARTWIELQTQREATRISVSYRARGDTSGRVVNLALLEPHVESAVEAGENAGERLTHANVVRAFVSQRLAADGVGSASFAPAAGVGSRGLIVLAYAQSSAQRDISGATSALLE